MPKECLEHGEHITGATSLKIFDAPFYIRKIDVAPDRIAVVVGPGGDNEWIKIAEFRKVDNRIHAAISKLD